MKRVLSIFLLIVFAFAAASSQTSVNAVSPAKYALNVAPSTSIQVTFSGAVLPSSFDDMTSFLVRGRTSGHHTGSFSFSAGNTVVTFVPTVPFMRGEEVVIDASNNIEDAASLPIEPFQWLFTVSVVPSPGTFASQVSYATGNGPVSAFAADVDGDADADIAVANQNSPTTASVFKNNGDGTFALRTDYTTGHSPTHAAVGDLDGDGDGDLVVVNSNAGVSILLNNSDGTYAAKTDYLTAGTPIASAIRDLDGDGDQDVAVASANGYLSILVNDGTGVFAFPALYPAGPTAYFVAAADIDNDGDADVAVASLGSAVVSVLKNNGDGTFAAKVDYPTASGQRTVYLGDVDADGDADLVAPNYYSNTVSILLNDGTGAFGAGVQYATGSNPFTAVLGDVDGDGDADLAITNITAFTVSVLKNNGDGTFAAKTDFGVGLYPYAVSFSDLDGDGDGDLAVANSGANTISILKGNPYPTFTITAGAGPNGAISPSGNVQAIGGSSPTFQMLPAPGYHVANVIVDQNNLGPLPDYQFVNVSADHSISVTFAINTYTLNVTAVHGSVAKNPDQASYTHGSNVQLSASPAGGYQFAGWSGDAGGVTNPLILGMTANKSVTALFELIPPPPSGQITGWVHLGAAGLPGVIVKLLDNQADPVAGVNNQLTSAGGTYAFTGLPAAEYLVMIVEPLGYYSDANPKPTTLGPGGSNQVDFALTAVTVINDGRGPGYWKHQFDVYITAQGQAQETAANLSLYIDRVHQYYTPHFGIFSGLTTFEDWQGVLSPPNNASMLLKAKRAIATLVLNFASLKIGQMVVVTADGRTAGDVLTYVSGLIVGGNPATYQTAKDLAEKVCNQQVIAAGLVPAGNILYKGESGGSVDWTFGAPSEFALMQNYPNPFNPVTSIRFSLPEQQFVSLRVFDGIGREVADLVHEVRSAGTHSVEFDARALPSGVYFYRIRAGSFLGTGKMNLIR